MGKCNLNYQKPYSWIFKNQMVIKCWFCSEIYMFYIYLWGIIFVFVKKNPACIHLVWIFEMWILLMHGYCSLFLLMFGLLWKVSQRKSKDLHCVSFIYYCISHFHIIAKFLFKLYLKTLQERKIDNFVVDAIIQEKSLYNHSNYYMLYVTCSFS